MENASTSKNDSLRLGSIPPFLSESCYREFSNVPERVTQGKPNSLWANRFYDFIHSLTRLWNRVKKSIWILSLVFKQLVSLVEHVSYSYWFLWYVFFIFSEIESTIVSTHWLDTWAMRIYTLVNFLYQEWKEFSMVSHVVLTLSWNRMVETSSENHR